MGLCWDELHTPDPESLIKSWHGKKGSLSAFTTAKLWGSATPATILLSPLSVSYRCYQNQKWRGTCNRKVFLHCAPSLDGVPAVSHCPVQQQWTHHGEHMSLGERGAQPHQLLRMRALRIQISHSAMPEQIQSIWFSLVSPPFSPCPPLRMRWSRRRPLISLHTFPFLGSGKTHGRRKTPTDLTARGSTFTNQDNQVWAKNNSQQRFVSILFLLYSLISSEISPSSPKLTLHWNKCGHFTLVATATCKRY